MAAALTRLQQAQTSVQASAQVFNSLQQSSLLNYLK
jgi:flagellar hook-associated protein 3 FlgL